MVAAEQRDQILQSTRVMYIAVKDLVEQGKAFLLGHPQADLQQRSTFDLFLVLAGFGQGTVAAVEIGIGHIIDYPRRPQAILSANALKELPLPSLGV